MVMFLEVWHKLVAVAILFSLHNPRANKPPTGLPPSLPSSFVVGQCRAVLIGVLLRRHEKGHVARYIQGEGEA
ncbi:hypothetical protein E2C01_045302 [Portunus trituberculatus]|uniref:Secreted protein n=1 Tax=Portunus trituberculatus TaxID=210409 RepID=A0A5B7G0W7_PORTR|nr:hypothetical protein [Portunus trituberculatus]